MANPRERKRVGEKHDMIDHEWTYQEIVPSSGWTEDAKFHHLLIDLPDFRKEDIRLQVDKSGKLIVIGGRLSSQDKYINFEKTFELPENSDAGKITGKFEGEILYISIPKIIKQSVKELGNEGATSSGYDEEEKEEDSDSENDSEEKDSPKGPDQKGKESENRSRKGNYYHEEWKKKYREEGNLFKVVFVKIKELKGIIVTAVLAFTLGMLVSQKLHPTPPK
ncbi:hypothetical protein Dimus_004858 [Dionaea muscipula]